MNNYNLSLLNYAGVWGWGGWGDLAYQQRWVKCGKVTLSVGLSWCACENRRVRLVAPGCVVGWRGAGRVPVVEEG